MTDPTSNPPDDNNDASSANRQLPRMDDEMQRVLTLIAARSRGEASNDAVEAAVTHLLQSTGCGNPATAAVATRPDASTTPLLTNAKQPIQTSQLHQQQPPQQSVETTTKIVADEDDYDDDDVEEGDDDGGEEDKQGNANSRKRPRKSKTPSKATPSRSIRRRRTSQQANNNNNNNNDHNGGDDDSDSLDLIPLGRQGAKMMTTFGDGSHPHHKAVAAALLGARHMLQVAIRDARAIRRRAKQHFDLAKIVTMTKKKTSLATHAATTAIDSTMLFRAMEGYDKLAFDIKCGFDMEQLRVLFPEEMNAYARWNEMHSEYVASTAEEQQQQQQQQDALDASAKGESLKEERHPQEEEAGHLQERVAQFDARTRIMNDDWYLKFAEMRRGSFLPRKIAAQEEAPDSTNDSNNESSSNNSNNSNKIPNWENRPPTSIRFLHWVGFDPRSSLPPPSEQITHALAFLCYDFFGRIVEKAVFLRNVRRHPDEDTESLTKELDSGDQLEPMDIELALQDPEIHCAPLYGGLDDEADPTEKPAVATQLYFGPGFEERLELEMEELLTGSKNKTTVSQEEQKIRVEEETLFEKLKKPPAVDRVGVHLLEDS